jgi:hypothetical protein
MGQFTSFTLKVESLTSHPSRSLAGVIDVLLDPLANLKEEL